MPETNYEEILTLTQATLPRYLGRPGEKFALVNEAAEKDVLAGRLFRRTRMSDEGGTVLKFPLQFEAPDVAQWKGPYTKGVLKGTRPVTWGSVPRRFLGWYWFKPYVELHLNRGKQQVLIDILKEAKQQVAVSILNLLELSMLARDGNYAHYGEGDDFLLPFGLFYWCTIDGLHVTGDTSRSVGGINPYSQALWKNPYINPVAASDGMAPITSPLQLRQALDRMFEEMRFDDITDWEIMSKDVSKMETPTVDPDSGETARDLMIWCDHVSSVEYRSILFDREDNVGPDQGRRRPKYKGIELRSSKRLGTGTYGYGYDHDGNALWTDRGGSYASGSWANHGEMVVINTRYFHVSTHPQHSPWVKKPYEPEGMAGIANEGDFWMNTICRSRRRGLGYIGPYPLDLAAA